MKIEGKTASFLWFSRMDSLMCSVLEVGVLKFEVVPTCLLKSKNLPL